MRQASFPLGWATAGARLLPDFMVIGAQRAGTTSVYRYLAQHPDVAPVRLGKGVHYFDTDPDKSFSWYRGHFPLDPAKVPGHRPTHTGEGAPYYIFHPLALQRMHRVLPEVKLIAILRDPVERAHSHWVHESARGFETLSFEAALHAEAERLAGEEERMIRDPGYYSFEHQHHSYIARGQYAPQVERMWSTYPAAQTLVLSARQLFEHPHETTSQVLEFLGLQPFRAEYDTYNARDYDPMEPDIRAWLDEQFCESDERIVELFGADFDWSKR